MAALLSLLVSAVTAAAPHLVVVSGAGRGVGLGVARQVLRQDAVTEVCILARYLDKAAAVASALGPRAHAVQCDVTDEGSCSAAARTIADIGGDALLSLVNNAGYAADLPWFPSPWPAEAARHTLAVNLFGAERLTRALLPHLLATRDGRVVFVSSGGGRLNMKRMSDARRRTLLDTDLLRWSDLCELAATFTAEYEHAASRQTAAGGQHLPYMSPSGLWLQSYGFSKACLGAYCCVLARSHPSLLSVTCSPGWVATDMSSTYRGDAEMRTIDEGGEVPAWLASGERGAMQTGFYMPDRSRVSWVAE